MAVRKQTGRQKAGGSSTCEEEWVKCLHRARAQLLNTVDNLGFTTHAVGVVELEALLRGRGVGTEEGCGGGEQSKAPNI